MALSFIKMSKLEDGTYHAFLSPPDAIKAFELMPAGTKTPEVIKFVATKAKDYIKESNLNLKASKFNAYPKTKEVEVLFKTAEEDIEHEKKGTPEEEKKEHEIKAPEAGGESTLKEFEEQSRDFKKTLEGEVPVETLPKILKDVKSAALKYAEFPKEDKMGEEKGEEKKEPKEEKKEPKEPKKEESKESKESKGAEDSPQDAKDTIKQILDTIQKEIPVDKAIEVMNEVKTTHAEPVKDELVPEETLKNKPPKGELPEEPKEPKGLEEPKKVEEPKLSAKKEPKESRIARLKRIAEEGKKKEPQKKDAKMSITTFTGMEESEMGPDPELSQKDKEEKTVSFGKKMPEEATADKVPKKETKPEPIEALASINKADVYEVITKMKSKEMIANAQTEERLFDLMLNDKTGKYLATYKKIASCTPEKNTYLFDDTVLPVENIGDFSRWDK